MPGSKRRRHTAPTPPVRNGAAHGSAMGGKRTEKKKKLADETRAKAYSQAGLDYDPRTAAGMRERDIQDLGSTKRARPPPYGKLLRSEATRERCAACYEYERLWHSAKSGEMPPPRFLPKVDYSSRPDAKLPTGAAAKQVLGKLIHAVGEEGSSLLYARVIEHRTYTAICSEVAGADPKYVTGAFVAAVDGAARFFGLIDESPLVKRMNQALEAEPAAAPSRRRARRPSSASAGSRGASARAEPSR